VVNPISLRDFNGGINWKSAKITLQSNEALRVQDLHLDPLERRRGSAMLTESPNDTLIGPNAIHSVYGGVKRDGTKRLYIVSDTTTVSSLFHGLGTLRMSPKFSYNISDSSGSPVTSLYDYIYTGEPLRSLTWKNQFIFYNARQKPVIVVDDSARDMMVQAPGEPRIFPMNRQAYYEFSGPTYDTTGLNGEYRYITVITSTCGSADSNLTIPDDGFETWTDDSNLTNWYEYNEVSNNYGFSKDSSNEIEGTYSLKIESKALTTAKCYVTDTFTNIVASTQYTLRANAKFEHQGGDGSATISVVEIPGTKVLASWNDNLNSRNDTSWFEITREFNTTDSSTGIELRLGYDGSKWLDSAIVYYDSITINVGTPEPLKQSYVSQPIKVFEELLLLKNLTANTISSECATTDDDFDKISFELYRTTAYPLEIIPVDTFWKIVEFNNIDVAILDTLNIIDSIPDSNLKVAPHDDFIIYDTIHYGRDTSSVITGFRVGAPTYVARNANAGYFIFVDSANDTTDTPIGGTSVLQTIMLWTDYMMTLYDTLIQAESDSGRTMRIETDTTQPRDSSYTVGLPPVPAGSSHLIRKLYRSMTYLNHTGFEVGNTVRDTIIRDLDERVEFIAYLRSQGRYVGQRGGLPIVSGGLTGDASTFGISILFKEFKPPRYDTVYSGFFEIAEIKGTDSAFVDTVTFDSAMQIARPYDVSVVPFDLDNLSKFNDRIWGSYRSSILWSEQDSGSIWSQFNEIVLNPDDGDEVTVINANRDFVEIYKNFSKFIISSSGRTDVDYRSNWVVNGYGCVAPQSMVPFQNGKFYLSHLGVVSEISSQTLTRASEYGIMSYGINPVLLNRPMSSLRTAIGLINDDEYWLSMPGTDTTWVYNITVGGWSIFTYSFTDYTFYDTLETSNLSPAQDLLIINDHSDFVYITDSTFVDSAGFQNDTVATGKIYYAKYETGPIGMIPGAYVTLQKIGTWHDWGHDAGGLTGFIKNIAGDKVDTFQIDIDNSESGYGLIALKEKISQYFTVEIGDTVLAGNVYNWDSLIINGLDIWAVPNGAVEIK
jgi:hypothetical protein